MPAIEDNAADLKSDFDLLEAPIVEEKPEPKKELKVEAPVEEEIEEEKEEKPEIENETEVEEVTDDDPKELLPHERPTMEEIKKKFPEFFKTFPTLQAAFNRERQFSEIFHTPQEAREASELAEVYSDLSEDIVSGTGEKLLPALKESDSLGKFSKNFLDNLYKVDQDLHWKMIAPVLEKAIRYLYNEGDQSNNDDIKNSALFAAKILLGDVAFADGKKTFITKDEPKKVDEEKQQWENERYNDFKISVHEDIYTSLTREIDKGFKAEENLTKFMKDSIRKEIIDRIVSTVQSDKEYQKYLDRLWLDAKKSGFRSSSKSSIINASLARAQRLIPSLRRALIAEALGSLPIEGQRKQAKVDEINSRKEPGSGRPSNGIKTPTAKQIDWRKTSDMDLLNDRIEIKKGR